MRSIIRRFRARCLPGAAVVALSSLAAGSAVAAGITVTPPSPITLFKDGSMYINAAADGGSNFNWTWQASAGTITRIGPAALPNSSAYYGVGGLAPGDYVVTARCGCLGVWPDHVSVTVTVPPVTISIEPVEAVPQTESRTLVAHVTHSNPEVTWSLAASAGSISGDVFTASRNEGLYTLGATSVADPSVTTTALLRVLPPVTVSVNPTEATVGAGSTRAFAASVQNSSNTAVTWTASGGTITAGGVFTAGSLGGPFTVRAVSVADTQASSEASVRVVALDVTPASVIVPPGTSRQFFARVTGSTQEVTWSTTAPGATLNTNGVFTPGPGTPLGTYSVTARTQGTPAVSRSASVVIQSSLPVIGVAVSPAATRMRAGGRLQLSAIVHGQNGEPHPQQGVSWSVTGPGAPSISATGLFVAPDLAGSYVVTARSSADPTRAATATLAVPREVVLSPSWSEVDLGGNKTFQARALGFGNPAVLWSVEEGSAGGSITSQGSYTAPVAAGTFHVVAQAAASAATRATATVSVSPLKDVRIVVTPDGVTLGPGEERQFSAEVTGLGDPSVTWSASAGSIDSKSGAFTAPAVTSGVIVTATSVQEPSQSGRAVVVVAEAVGQDFTYDAAGQLLSDGARSFEWDAEGRLTAVTAGTRRTEFAYDAWDRPFLASVRDNGVITSRRRLLWLDDRLIEERSLPASGPETPVARYFFGGAQMDGAARFYVYDHRSGLRQLVDQTGQVVGRYDYDPFGQVTNREGPPPPFGFAGYREDPTTGLALTPARAYDATLGRWLSRDPIEEEGGLNLYAYALNDPVNLRDPSGLSPHDRQPTRQPQEPLCTAENPYGCPPGYVCDGRGAPRPCPVGHWCLNGRPTKIPSGPDIRRPPSAPHAADFGPQRPRPVGLPGRFYLITATNPEDVRTNPDWGSDLDPDDRKWIRLGVNAWSFLASFAAGANQRRGMGTPGPGSGSSSYGVGGTTLTPVTWPPGAGRP